MDGEQCEAEREQVEPELGNLHGKVAGSAGRRGGYGHGRVEGHGEPAHGHVLARLAAQAEPHEVWKVVELVALTLAGAALILLPACRKGVCGFVASAGQRETSAEVAYIFHVRGVFMKMPGLLVITPSTISTSSPSYLSSVQTLTSLPLAWAFSTKLLVAAR